MKLDDLEFEMEFLVQLGISIFGQYEDIFLSHTSRTTHRGLLTLEKTL